jgi:hypothetical protein
MVRVEWALSDEGNLRRPKVMVQQGRDGEEISPIGVKSKNFFFSFESLVANAGWWGAPSNRAKERDFTSTEL